MILLLIAALTILPNAELPDHCEVCGLPPRHKQQRPLVYVKETQEWTCEVCLSRNEVERVKR